MFKVGVMRRIITGVVVFCLLAISGGCVTTQPKGPADIVADGCKSEIETYCKGVTHGEGRVLADRTCIVTEFIL
jgi:hypothetical protein